MKLLFSIFWKQKLKEAPELYEDASSLGKNQIIDVPCKIAISDGAGTTAFAGTWAKILVNTFSASDEEFEPEFFLQKTWKCWRDKSELYLRERILMGRPLNFWERPNFEKGPYATFLGVIFEKNADNQNVSELDNSIIWIAYAVGDSCLFQIRENNLFCCFPLNRSDVFNSFPELLPGKENATKKPWELFTMCKGDLQHGDILYLLTDAIAKWFLKMYENGNKPWAILKTFDNTNKDDFDRWIEAMKNDHVIEDDDITIVSIEYE